MPLVIDQTAEDFAALMSADWRRQVVPSQVEDLLGDWFSYRARSIPPAVRRVRISDAVRSKAATYPAISTIVSRLRSAGDVSPWLSDTIRKRRADPFADPMFNDWQVIHFHLGGVYAARDKIARTADLLFAYVTHDEAILLDVRPHGAWSEIALLKKLLDTAPEVMERYRLRGVLGVSKTSTDQDRGRLRHGGVNVPLEIDGKVFMAPGSGVVASRHALRFVRLTQKWRDAIDDLTEQLRNGSDADYARGLAGSLGIPVVLGVLCIGPWLHVYDRRREIEFGTFGPIC